MAMGCLQMPDGWGIVASEVLPFVGAAPVAALDLCQWEDGQPLGTAPKVQTATNISGVAILNNVTTIIDALLADHGTQEGALLPILHATQAALGYIPGAATSQIASALNLSRAEVDGVISFYGDFRRTPAAATVIKICRAEACQARGARALEAHAKAILGVEFGASSQEQGVHLEAVYCLGNCACGPSVTINNQLHARVSPAIFDQLLASIDGGNEP